MKEKKFPYRKGETILIYDDWEFQSGKTILGRLIRRVSVGLPFVLRDSLHENKQIYYNHEKWVVFNINTKREEVRKIRYICHHGTMIDESNKSEYIKPEIVDEFLKVDGKEIY